MTLNGNEGSHLHVIGCCPCFIVYPVTIFFSLECISFCILSSLILGGPMRDYPLPSGAETLFCLSLEVAHVFIFLARAEPVNPVVFSPMSIILFFTPQLAPLRSLGVRESKEKFFTSLLLNFSGSLFQISFLNCSPCTRGRCGLMTQCLQTYIFYGQ